MLWSIGFSVAVFAAMVYIYIDLIRPKLHAIEALDPYFDRADERYARWWQVVKGWRVEATLFLGVALLELPDLIDLLTGADLVSLLPMEYQKPAQTALVILAFVRAYLTKRSAERRLDE